MTYARSEDRIGGQAESLTVAVWGYAVMSNPLRVVVEVIPQGGRHLDRRRGRGAPVPVVSAPESGRQRAG